jgi:hypothetical protein
MSVLDVLCRNHYQDEFACICDRFKSVSNIADPILLEAEFTWDFATDCTSDTIDLTLSRELHRDENLESRFCFRESACDTCCTNKWFFYELGALIDSWPDRYVAGSLTHLAGPGCGVPGPSGCHTVGFYRIQFAIESIDQVLCTDEPRVRITIMFQVQVPSPEENGCGTQGNPQGDFLVPQPWIGQTEIFEIDAVDIYGTWTLSDSGSFSSPTTSVNSTWSISFTLSEP